VSSAHTASDESPPRKRTGSGSVKPRRRRQPTAKRKRCRNVETSEEEDDGPPAAEEADIGLGSDHGTQTKASAHANCLAASCTMTAADCRFCLCLRPDSGISDQAGMKVALRSIVVICIRCSTTSRSLRA
jgi:hypothetical protein